MVAYKLKSRVLQAISNIIKPTEEIMNTGKALVGATKYNMRRFGAIIGANAPKYDFRKIRQIYRRFGFIRQALSVYKNRATSELPDIVCDNFGARKKLMERLEEMEIFQHLPNIFQDLPLFGNTFYEILYEEEEIETDNSKYIDYEGSNYINISKKQDLKAKARRLKRILGIKRLEPDYMRIVQDKYGRILYFVNIRDSANPIVLEKWRIIHILLDPLPGDAFGIGLVEGAVDDISALRMVEDLQLQLIKHDIYPFRMFSCPGNDIIVAVEEKLAEQERFGDLVVPAEVKMTQSTVGNASQDLRALMTFYKEKIFMDLGVPMQMLIEGTKTNKSTAGVQSDAFNHNVYALINQVYLPMEKFCKLVLLFEGIDSNVVWNYKDIDRSGESVLRSEIVQWHKNFIIDTEDAIALLDTYGAFRYMNEKQKAKIFKKSKIKTQGQIEGEESLGLPEETDGDYETQEPEFGDRIVDESNIVKPKKITDRIVERITKPDGTKVEKTTERIKQAINLTTILRDKIINCNLDKIKISDTIVDTMDMSGLNINEISNNLENFCNDLDECINLYKEDNNDIQYEYLVSKVCADFSRAIIGKFDILIEEKKF